MLQAVVKYGGFAQAAEAIHKSQSTINHAVHKLQDRLGLPLLEVVGRKAQLTDAGAQLLRRADHLLDEVQKLEDAAQSLARGTEAEIRLAVDAIYPADSLADALQELSLTFPDTRVQLLETVLSGGNELLLAGEVDVLVSGSIPPGFVGEPLMRVEFMAVANPEHPLHRLGRPLTLGDLRLHRQIVIRDSARESSVDSGWLGAEQRWTVSHIATSVDMIARGMGFAWLPVPRIAPALQSGTVAPLPLAEGGRRYSQVYLVYADADSAGPASRRLGELLARCCEHSA